jgi:hypothetical protein
VFKIFEVVSPQKPYHSWHPEDQLRYLPGFRAFRRKIQVVIYSVFLILALNFFSFTNDTKHSENSKPIVREAKKVSVAGLEEVWRLEWDEQPTPICDPKDAGWITCPCQGFAYGEQGNLSLIRIQKNKVVERLCLTPFFNNDLDAPDINNKAILRRWDVKRNDADLEDTADFEKIVHERPLSTIMQFADYNHDGQATEFFLQSGVLPCGKRMGIIVGISRLKPTLHAFGTSLHPEKPLVMNQQNWKAFLRSKKPVRLMEWRCGDHGSDTETEIELDSDRKGISATLKQYQCSEKDQRGTLIENKPL